MFAPKHGSKQKRVEKLKSAKKKCNSGREDTHGCVPYMYGSVPLSNSKNVVFQLISKPNFQLLSFSKAPKSTETHTQIIILMSSNHLYIKLTLTNLIPLIFTIN